MFQKLFYLGINLGLRGGSLLAKFALMIYVTRYIGLEAVGIFGLLQAANVIGTKLVGYGLYFVANREMVDLEPKRQAGIIYNQQAAYAIGYGLVLILALAAWPLIPSAYQVYMLYSVALLIVAHQVLELGNILIALHRPLACNFIFGVTNGLWAIPPVILGLFVPEYRTLETILLGWLLGALLSWLVALWFLRILPFRPFLGAKPDWTWLKTSLRRGLPLFLAIMTMNAGLYIDRYVISWLTNAELTGVFVMFWSFAYAVQILMQTGVLVNEYPKMIADYKRGDEPSYWQRFRSLSWRMAWGGGIACVLAVVTVTPIVHFVEKPLALEHIGLFYVMLLAFWIRLQADVSNYALYARHQDKALAFSYLMNLIVASLSNLVFVWLWGLAGAAVAQIVTALALTGLQGWLLWRKRHERLEGEAMPSGV
jgi:O-antigen/teichoic acid export membrane protein